MELKQKSAIHQYVSTLLGLEAYQISEEPLSKKKKEKERYLRIKNSGTYCQISYEGQQAFSSFWNEEELMIDGEMFLVRFVESEIKVRVILRTLDKRQGAFKKASSFGMRASTDQNHDLLEDANMGFLKLESLEYQTEAQVLELKEEEGFRQQVLMVLSFSAVLEEREKIFFDSYVDGSAKADLFCTINNKV